MVAFPNSKINIGLHITGKREDGYHNLVSCMYPVNLCDALEINVSAFETNLVNSGFYLNEKTSENLCIKAYNILKNDFPEILPVNIHLHKAIPFGAGLGGGSSDAAHMLKLLNKKFSLGLSEYQLLIYAAKIGSDCSFFIQNKPAIIKGKGNVLEPAKINLQGYKILLVKPGIHINTKKAFSRVSVNIRPEELEKSLLKPVEEWRDCISNDFEKYIFIDHPELEELKYLLYRYGASYASMTGSGSTVYGIFKEHIKVQNNFARYFSCWVK